MPPVVRHSVQDERTRPSLKRDVFANGDGFPDPGPSIKSPRWREQIVPVQVSRRILFDDLNSTPD
jgi:hypothetical protein